jgi:hypothetical protein
MFVHNAEKYSSEEYQPLAELAQRPDPPGAAILTLPPFLGKV